MTREEQIIEAGIDYTMSVRPMCVGGLSFEEDIRKMNRNKSFEEGAKWADKTTIQKAQEYLRTHLWEGKDDDNDSIVESVHNITLNDFIKDFIRYLEE